MVSYWKIFRLIFVLFSLYLLRDAFYRWDGFRYHSTFYDFLPSVALITILWSIVAVLGALLIWLLYKILECFCYRKGWKFRIEHLIFFVGIFTFLGILLWIGRKTSFPYIDIRTLRWKIIIFSGITFLALSLTLLFRHKVIPWTELIQQRITPLVYLFSIWFAISLPLVVYPTLAKQGEKVKWQVSATNKKRLNIILVTFDALTARDMSVYGFHRPTTPFIATWAKKAHLFRNVQAESNYTTPTTASLMTGKRVWTHRLYHPHGYKAFKSNIESLPLVLKNNGYYTMAFIQNPYASVIKLGVSNGFHIAPPPSEFRTPTSLYGIIDKLLYKFFGDKIREYNWIIKTDFILYKIINVISQNFSVTSTPPESVFNRLLWVIDKSPPEPFFAWLHLHPPHDPYLPPEPYKGMFNSSPKLMSYKSQKEILKYKYQYYPDELQPTVDILRTRYDEFIRYCDKQFEDFIKQLTKRGKLKNTVIILSSDHGESFEHNYLQHRGEHLYEQVTHIPLIIREPQQSKGQVITHLVEQIDIPTTILDLAHIPIPRWMEGRSLVPLMRGKKLTSKPAFSMALYRNPSRGNKITKGTIAIWEGDYKLIHYIEQNRTLLFNLKQDPDELNNLIDKEPEVVQRLIALIKGNLKRANERIGQNQSNVKGR